jgi:hypothetical protein
VEHLSLLSHAEEAHAELPPAEIPLLTIEHQQRSKGLQQCNSVTIV